MRHTLAAMSAMTALLSLAGLCAGHPVCMVSMLASVGLLAWCEGGLPLPLQKDKSNEQS
jgi:hypothetical protein